MMLCPRIIFQFTVNGVIKDYDSSHCSYNIIIHIINRIRNGRVHAQLHGRYNLNGIPASVYCPRKCCDLLSFSVHLVHRHADCLLKKMFSCLYHFSMCMPPATHGPTEIRSRISTAAAMVRSTATVCKSIAVWIFKCHSSSRGDLAARYVFHHAWRLQGSDYTDAFRATNLSQRHNQLSDEVCYNLFYVCHQV